MTCILATRWWTLSSARCRRAAGSLRGLCGSVLSPFCVVARIGRFRGGKRPIRATSLSSRDRREMSSLPIPVRQRSARSWRVLTENRGRRGPMSRHPHWSDTFPLVADYPPRFFLREASLRPWISVKTRHETGPSLSNRDWYRPGRRARSRRCCRRPRPLGGKGPPEAPGYVALGGPVRPLPTAVRRG